MNIELIYKKLNLKKKLKKNQKKVFIEFNNQKWKKLLDSFSKEKEIKKIDENFFNKKILIYYKNKYNLIKFSRSKDIQAKIYYDYIKNFFNKERSVVEIGSGYGSIIFRLMKMKKIKNCFFYSLDNSINAIKIVKKIKRNNNIKNLKAEFCDLYKGKSKAKIPKNAIIYTSYCLHYGKKISNKFIEYILKLKPSLVFHFEPIYELYKNDKTKSSKLIKNYFKFNDYSRNLLSMIKKYEKKRKIRIIKIKKNLISPNIFLPISLIIWRPTNN